MKKFTKSVVSVLLALIMALSVLTVAPFAASADLAVSVDETSCLQGSLVTATIYFPASYNKAAALDVQLKYDRAKLEFVSMAKGASLEQALDDQINGAVYSEYSGNPGVITWVIAGSNNFSFNGAFAVVVFKVRDTAANGKTELNLEVTNAANSGYVDITSSVVTADAEIDIVRNSVNDFRFELNAEKTAYTVSAYLCGTVSELTVPAVYNGLPVVAIGDSVFTNHSELTSIVLPDSLQSIGDYAFSSCRGIKSITIPDSVTSIGVSAFYGCQALETVQLPLGITEIADNTFNSCYALKTVEIPFTVKKIGATAFYQCIYLESVKISKNTTSIGKNAFPNGIEFVTVAGNTYLPELISTTYKDSTIKIVEDISLGTVTCNTADVEYTGAPITPNVSVKLTNGNTVANGKEYKVVYAGNQNVGTAKVYVVGIDTYGEGYVVSFKITCDHDNLKVIEIVQRQTCTVDGVYRLQCQLCGTIVKQSSPAKGHPSFEWVYDKRPTVKATGIKHKVCTVCNESYELNTIAAKIIPDANLDGKVNSTDALLVLQYSVGKKVYLTPEGLFNADTNADGKINSTDALQILKLSVAD